MQNTEFNHKDVAMLFEGMVDMINHSELGIKGTQAVLTKVLVLLALSSGTSKQEFLDQLEYVWEFENFFQPDEKH